MSAVWQYVAVCCCVLHCVAVHCIRVCGALMWTYCIHTAAGAVCTAVWCSVLQYGAVCCRVLPDIPMTYRGHTAHILWIHYGLATIDRLLKDISLFCRIQSLLSGSFAKETYNFKEPTNRNHPICGHTASHAVNLQCVAVCGSVLQCVAVRCSALIQYVCSMWTYCRQLPLIQLMQCVLQFAAA